MEYKMTAKNVLKTLLCLIGAGLFVNGLMLCLVSNIHTGIILTALLGVLLVLWGVFFDTVERLTKKGILKALKIAVVAAICFEACLVGYVALVGEGDTVTYDEDALIVLGAGIRGENVTLPLKARLDMAVDYHKKNPDAVIIVSGGKGQGESITEATAMKRYLVSAGVPKEIVIEEHKATSTSENMKYSKEILAEYFGDDVKIAFVTNNFHIFRSARLAKMAGFDNVTYIHTSIPWYNYVPCYIRETLAIFKMWILKY